jgi:hypothetical protein
MQNQRSYRLYEVVFLAMAITAAAVLRAWPLAEVSLWWDELVHLQTAARENLLDMLQTVRLGIPPGGGNAGAVPLDYLLLHAWLRFVPRPSLDWLEAYFRFPSLLFSVATVAAVYFCGRRFFDRSIALVASTILALSVSHALYAAEVRFYSLLSFLAAVNLYAFCAVVMQRWRTRPWLGFTLVNVLYFMSGLLSLLLLAVQYAVLIVLLIADIVRARTGPDRLVLPAAATFAVPAVVALYFAQTGLAVHYGRRDHPSLEAWSATEGTLRFFALGNDFLYWSLVAGFALVLVYGWKRDTERFAIAAQLVSTILMIPVIVLLARWKEYYFHPRHALFLWPAFALISGTGLVFAARSIDPLRRIVVRQRTREMLSVAGILCLVVATQIPPAARYLSDPTEQLARTKSLRDFKTLAAHLRARVDHLAPGQLYLLIVERGPAGHLGNPVLSKYLEWYGLDQVLLRGTDDPLHARAEVSRVCPDGCLGQPTQRVQIQLLVRSPFEMKQPIQDLVGLAPMRPDPRPIGAVGVLQYWGSRGIPPRAVDGFATTHFAGVSLFEKSDLP